MITPQVALTIAGSDSGGAAGIAADLATFASYGVHGTCAITAVTAQHTGGVDAIHPVPAAVVAAQLGAVLDDLPVAAMKTGMLGSAEIAEVVAQLVEKRSGGCPLVVDPVLLSSTGAALGDDDLVTALREVLLPVAAVVSPNLAEARALLGADGPPHELAVALTEHCPAVVLTGGPEAHALGDTLVCVDWLARRGRPPVPVEHAAVATGNDHGTGCTFSAALAAELALGAPLVVAVEGAAAFVHERLVRARFWQLGRGRGPVAHTTIRYERNPR